MNATKPAAERPLRSLLLLLLFALFGATAVVHDYLCQEHLHELGCPLHGFYENPGAFEAASFFGGLPPRMFRPCSRQEFHPDEFIKNIFHPPDGRS